jgi:hypothetical protein
MSLTARVLAFAMLASAGARAADTPCNCSLLEKEEPSPFPLAPNRHGELLVDVGLSSDWNGRTDGPKNLGHARPAVTLGVTGAVATWHQRFRLGIRAGWHFGKWGDDDREAVSFVPGANIRLSFLMLDIWDVYGIWRADVPVAIGDRSAVGLRFGTGLGVRVARGFSLEGTFDAITAVDHRFRNVGRPDVTPGMTISLAFDLCLVLQGFSGCHTEPPKPTQRDFTCRLYREASQACTTLPRASTCQAVEDALASTPRDGQDSMGAFLEALATRVPELASLARAHAELWADAEHRREQARIAAQSRHELVEHCAYAPIPVEIRRSLGCDDGNGCPKIACD